MKTHDYTERYWGHDFVIRQIDGHRMEMSGWGNGLSKGDFLILPNEGSTTRYKIITVEYLSDPRDMWHATVEFAPRMEIQPA